MARFSVPPHKLRRRYGLKDPLEVSVARHWAYRIGVVELALFLLCAVVLLNSDYSDDAVPDCPYYDCDDDVTLTVVVSLFHHLLLLLLAEAPVSLVRS